MKPVKTLGECRNESFDLRITCRWCGSIRVMLIGDAIEAAMKKRGGPFTHISAFAEEVKCSKCGFKKALVEPDDGEFPGKPKAAPLVVG
jgi:ribosomal protein S27E